MNLQYSSSAQKSLKQLKKSDAKMFKLVWGALEDLSKSGFESPNIKRLQTADLIFRKRVGRWRILFIPLMEDSYRVCIIEVKKDSRDYPRWINNIAAFYKINDL